MYKILKEIRILDNKQPPYFQLLNIQTKFSSQSIIVKVLAFSLDPVMRVWLSGAKTNYRQVKNGDIFNCFGIGVVEQSSNQNYPVGEYIFGNTGTVSYFQLNEQKQKECFIIDRKLVQMYSPSIFIYLINNGLAAYAGFQILGAKEDDKVVVSTAAGATGLLLCHLLKKRGVQIIAVSSKEKQIFLQDYTSIFFDYSDRETLTKGLKNAKFTKYFDNVGQSQLDLVLATIQDFGVLAMCGTIDNYLNPKEGGIKNYLNIISKRLRLEGINFSHLFGTADLIFEQFRDAKLHKKVISMEQFIPHFLEIFKKGSSIVGKVVIDPHL